MRFLEVCIEHFGKIASSHLKFVESGSQGDKKRYKVYQGKDLVGVATVDHGNQPTGFHRRRDWPNIQVSGVGGKPCFARRGIARELRDRIHGTR